MLGSIFLLLQAMDFRASAQLWGSVPRSLFVFVAYVGVHSLFYQTPSGALLHLLLLIAPLGVALELLREGDSRVVEKTMRALALINIFYGCLQIMKVDPIFESYAQTNPHIPLGFMGHRTLYGPLMVMLAGYHFPRRAYKTALACLVMAIAARSAVTLLSVFACVATILWLRRRYSTLVVVGLLGLLGGVIGFTLRHKIDFFADKGRFSTWALAFSESLTAPWFGHGFLSFAKIFGFRYQIIQGMPWHHAHQELLQVFFELGIFGLLLVGWMLRDLFVRARRRGLDTGEEAWLLVCVAGLANSLANFPLHIAPLALFTLCGWIVLARRNPRCAESGNCV